MLEKKNFYINGKWVGPKKPNDIMVVNPATEKSCAVISLAGKEESKKPGMQTQWPRLVEFVSSVVVKAGQARHARGS